MVVFDVDFYCLIYICVLDMLRFIGFARGHSVGHTGGRGIDNMAFVTFFLVQDRGRRGHGWGTVVAILHLLIMLRFFMGFHLGRLWLRP